MARKLFGTDGVRGAVGDLLTADLARRLGRAAAAHAPAERPRVLIIRDTRESGWLLEGALADGIRAAGGEVLLGGVLPTPAAPLLIRRYGLDLAAVVSASHNPYTDNGIKFFAGDGFKLSDETELEIERELEEGADVAVPTGGEIRDLRAADEDYLRELGEHFAGLDLAGLDVLLDCANGATYSVAPEIFRRLGADVTVVHAEPDGRNINSGCGSTHVDALAAAVKAGGHAVGFAFDGDGDRVLAVDGAGRVVDGDELIALAAVHLQRQGELRGGVVVTVMTNYGFHVAMRDAGIEVDVTQVGDRYVLAELRARGWRIGGEQSGHIIDMAFNTTGDGIASALLALQALGGEDLTTHHPFARLPQRLVNVTVRDRTALPGAQAVTSAVESAEHALAGRGRVLVRASGTEQLVRVMVEAPTEEEAERVCGELVTVVSQELA
ncbi:MAG TPA: phosphoglucosamine mutase [Solirubrobacteraceae bacterium]|nr:phosphoglucosamine mutase [Solirubrobacteraceae bacterium]